MLLSPLAHGVRVFPKYGPPHPDLESRLFTGRELNAMKAQDRLGLDVSAMLLIVIQSNPVVTRMTIHEVIGLVLIVPLATHVILNWAWVTTAIGKFTGKMRPTMRLNLIVDTGLFVSMVGVGMSGVLLVPGLAVQIALPASPLWHAAHLAMANLTVAFFLAHFGLHARWMFNQLRRMIDPSASPPPKRVAPRTAAPGAAAIPGRTPAPAATR